METFDYVIVGAGSAGCALAERLSADPRRSVLLIEAGGTDRRFWIRTPIGYGKTFQDGRVNWRFMAEPDPGLGGRETYVPRGKVLGGSSSINAMVYVRGLPGDFDDWRDAGNPGWGWADVRPVFEAMERHVAEDGGVTGDGPVWVSNRAREYHPIRRRFLAAAEEIGLPATADMNGDAPEGVAPYAITTRGGLRWSAADAFLRPAQGRPNLRIVTDAQVLRVRFEGRRAIGVEARRGGATDWQARRGGATDGEARRDGATVVFGARAGVILSAGAIGSPLLLQLSGIGPGASLQRLGIGVVEANDAVGGGLQDHVGVNYAYRATEPTLNQVLGTWAGRMRAGARFLLTRSGPLSLSVNQMGGLVRSRPDAPRADMQLYFNPLSYSAGFAGKRPLTMPDPYPGFILSFNPCRPTSMGRVDLAAPDPFAPPRIVTNYLSTEADVAQILDGARLIGRLQETAAMRALIAAPPAFDPTRASDAEIVADFRARSGSVYHLSGTCRMAPRDRGGVVDAGLRVHGVDGLWVADSSIFPNVTSGNTNAPSLMVGRRAGALIGAA